MILETVTVFFKFSWITTKTTRSLPTEPLLLEKIRIDRYATNILIHLTLYRLINSILNSILERHWPYFGKLSSAAMKFCIMHDCLVGLRSGQVIFINGRTKVVDLVTNSCCYLILIAQCKKIWIRIANVVLGLAIILAMIKFHAPAGENHET